MASDLSVETVIKEILGGAGVIVRMATRAAEGVVDVLSGKRPQFVVNPEVFKQ